MQAKRLIILVGFVLLLVGLIWWGVFYGRAADYLGQPVTDYLGNAVACTVYTTEWCSGIVVLATVFGFTAYKPFILWAALACLLVGFVAPAGRSRET